jgi:hypothetical protein
MGTEGVNSGLVDPDVLILYVWVVLGVELKLFDILAGYYLYPTISLFELENPGLYDMRGWG